MSATRDEAAEFHRKNKAAFPLELRYRVNELKNLGNVPRKIEELKRWVREKFGDTTEGNRILAYYKLYGFATSPKKGEVEGKGIGPMLVESVLGMKVETANPAAIAPALVSAPVSTPVTAPVTASASPKRKEGDGAGGKRGEKKPKIEKEVENEESLPPNKQWQAEPVVMPTLEGGTPPILFLTVPHSPPLLPLLGPTFDKHGIVSLGGTTGITDVLLLKVINGITTHGITTPLACTKDLQSAWKGYCFITE